MPPLPMRLETASRRVLGPPRSPPRLHSPTRRRPAGHRLGPRSALSRTPARRRFPPLARPVRPGSARMGDRAGAGSNCRSVAEVRTEIHGHWLIRPGESQSSTRRHGLDGPPRPEIGGRLREIRAEGITGTSRPCPRAHPPPAPAPRRTLRPGDHDRPPVPAHAPRNHPRPRRQSRSTIPPTSIVASSSAWASPPPAADCSAGSTLSEGSS